jgi:FtsP/CotA-like multicopper oxidase with cupredoxin domain
VGRGSTVDILLEADNPGEWYAECRIPEHLEAGMRMRFLVE